MKFSSTGTKPIKPIQTSKEWGFEDEADDDEENDKNVMIVVAQGMVSVLVWLLDSSSLLEMKEKIVAAVSRVLLVESSKHVLIADGLLLLNHLLQVLESGSFFAKEKFCIALQALTFSKENARAIEENTVFVLIQLACSGKTLEQENSIVCLCNLILNVENLKVLVVKENRIECLKNLLDSCLNPKSLEVAIEFTKHLAY